MSNIILPGDSEWSGPQAEIPETPKLPDEVLEAAFTEAVADVQNMIAEGGPVADEPNNLPVAPGDVATEVGKNLPALPNSYRFHNPAQKKSIDIPVPKPIDVELLEDLPRQWEKVCFHKFRKGDHITLTSMTFYPGVGVLYGFSEGTRGGFGVRPDQFSFSVPEVDEPPQVITATQTMESPTEEIAYGTLDGYDPQI